MAASDYDVAVGAMGLVGVDWITRTLAREAPSLAGGITDAPEAVRDQLAADYAGLDRYADVQDERIAELSDENAALALENAYLRGGPLCAHAPYHFGDERQMCVLGPEIDRLRAGGERVVLRPIVHHGETIGLELCTVETDAATRCGGMAVTDGGEG